MKPIVFLDFDGVISTFRAWVANRHIEDTWTRWLDPIAMLMLAELADRHPFEIVVTSTWRKKPEEAIRALLEPSGLTALLHSDWRTKDLWVMGDSNDSRSQEIIDWLERNGNPEYIILDDDTFNWTDEQTARWVHTHAYDGLTFDNWQAAEKLLESFKE